MDSQLIDANALQQCRTRLHELQRLSDDVCELMRGVARALRDTGESPDPDAVEQLAQFRQDYERLRDDIPPLGHTIGIQGEERSLNAIQTELESLALVRATLERLEFMSTIQHVDQPGFEPWQNCLADGTRLREQLLASTAAEARTVAEDFLSAPTPLNATITLITDGAALSDERWSVLLDSVAEAYGRELSTAIARGKLNLIPNTRA